MEDRQDVIRRLDHPGYASTFLSTFDIKMEMLDYLTFGVSRFITWR